MTRQSNKKKYERILERLVKGEKQSSIVIAEKCSYGTISAAKQWDKNGRPASITTTRSTSTNTTKIVLSIPNFWLECLNEDIMSGIWNDYSDAIVDIIRTYFRTRMEPQTQVQIEPLRGRGLSRLRRNIMKELKESFTPEQFRKFFRTSFGDDDSIPTEREEHYKDRKSEFLKEINLIESRFKGQESEDYTFINYHGQPLIKEESEIIIELEKEVGEIPRWNYTLVEDLPKTRELGKFSYVFFGNHIIGLIIVDKGLTRLPKSINQLKFLQHLDLRNNNLTELPESIGQLEYLEELILHDNKLRSIPNSIGNLKNLGILHLENNELTTLPDTICNLKTWYPIGLSYNKIASLSEKILETCMPQVKVTKYARVHGIRKKISCELDLVGNPIMKSKTKD
jgi:hypothetical protein